MLSNLCLRLNSIVCFMHQESRSQASRTKISCIKNQGLKTTLTLRAGNLNLTGPLPDVAATDSPLQVLTLYNNHLTGTLPASLGSATQLTNLDVSSNSLTGAFFLRWGYMVRASVRCSGYLAGGKHGK